MVLEFLENGDLKSFLQKHGREKTSFDKLLLICEDVSQLCPQLTSSDGTKSSKSSRPLTTHLRQLVPYLYNATSCPETTHPLSLKVFSDFLTRLNFSGKVYIPSFDLA